MSLAWIAAVYCLLGLLGVGLGVIIRHTGAAVAIMIGGVYLLAQFAAIALAIGGWLLVRRDA